MFSCTGYNGFIAFRNIWGSLSGVQTSCTQSGTVTKAVISSVCGYWDRFQDGGFTAQRKSPPKRLFLCYFHKHDFLFSKPQICDSMSLKWNPKCRVWSVMFSSLWTEYACVCLWENQNEQILMLTVMKYNYPHIHHCEYCLCLQAGCIIDVKQICFNTYLQNM